MDAYFKPGDQVIINSVGANDADRVEIVAFDPAGVIVKLLSEIDDSPIGTAFFPWTSVISILKKDRT